MTLYFVRHGETDWNVRKKIQGKTDIPLNENGKLQAQELAAMLLGEKITGKLKAERIYTSPQLRAECTAEAVADALTIECVRLAELREMDLGEWEGLKWDYIREAYGSVYEYWNSHRRYTNTPGGENYNEVLARTLAGLEKILSREINDVIVVTHSAVLMALRCYLAGRPFEEMVGSFKTGNAKVVPIASADLSRAIKRFARGE